MCGLGATEMVIILILALLVFGPSKLPELAKGVGRALREFKKASKEVKDQVSSDEDLNAAMREVEAARLGVSTPEDPPRKITARSGEGERVKVKEKAAAAAPRKTAVADDDE